MLLVEAMLREALVFLLEHSADQMSSVAQYTYLCFHARMSHESQRAPHLELI